jgi:hypothetical protein
LEQKSQEPLAGVYKDDPARSEWTVRLPVKACVGRVLASPLHWRAAAPASDPLPLKELVPTQRQLREMF